MSNRRKISLAKLARVIGEQLTREQLADQHRAIIARNWRTMDDHDGRVPQRLLDDLAAVADQHATEAVGEAVTEQSAARRRAKAT